jgi:sigma-B regulation protein RsbU (phosphoserine phosphatase)
MSSEDQLARYKTLVDIARCFGRAVDLDALIDEILNRSQAVMQAEACSLFLPDSETNELILHSTDPRLASLDRPLRVPPGKGIAGAVFQSRESVNIADVPNDARYYSPLGQQVGFVTRAMLAIPLLDGAQCVGVMQALNPAGRPVFDDRDQEIFEGFGGLIANALLRIEAERKRMELVRSKQELHLAREIQESFLPPSAQKFPFCEVRLHNSPAYTVGGDFSCVHRIGEHRLLLGLGDVTGKGIPAALSMARATAMIKGMASQATDDLGGWVTNLNEQLVQDLQGGRFIGMTFMLADAADSSLHVCTAGQFPPLHQSGKEWTPFAISNHLPLGIASGIKYRTAVTELKPGESWLLVSDGITEGRNQAGEDYSMERLRESLPVGQSSEQTVAAAISAWRKYMNGAPQHDDASLLLLRWRGRAPAADLETICCPENLCLGRQFVEQWAVFAGFDDVTVGQIVMAGDEAASNVFRHAYQADPGPLALHAEVDQEVLTIQISDRAKPVDIAKVKGRELSDLRPGGLGTFIMSKVFDEVNYSPMPAGTTLTLRKKLPS